MACASTWCWPPSSTSFKATRSEVPVMRAIDRRRRPRLGIQPLILSRGWTRGALPKSSSASRATPARRQGPASTLRVSQERLAEQLNPAPARVPSLARPHQAAAGKPGSARRLCGGFSGRGRPVVKASGFLVDLITLPAEAPTTGRPAHWSCGRWTPSGFEALHRRLRLTVAGVAAVGPPITWP